MVRGYSCRWDGRPCIVGTGHWLEMRRWTGRDLDARLLGRFCLEHGCRGAWASGNVSVTLPHESPKLVPLRGILTLTRTHLAVPNRLDKRIAAAKDGSLLATRKRKVDSHLAVVAGAVIVAHEDVEERVQTFLEMLGKGEGMVHDEVESLERMACEATSRVPFALRWCPILSPPCCTMWE